MWRSQAANAFYRPLRTFITPMVGSSLVDDILQEIALAIFQNLRYLRHPEAFRPWAFRLASRRAFRYLKRETRWKLQTDSDLISALPGPELLPEALEPGLLAVIEKCRPRVGRSCSFTISNTSRSKKRRSFLTSPLERPSRASLTACPSSENS